MAPNRARTRAAIRTRIRTRVDGPLVKLLQKLKKAHFLSCQTHFWIVLS
jgi:hypothetical protein